MKRKRSKQKRSKLKNKKYLSLEQKKIIAAAEKIGDGEWITTEGFSTRSMRSLVNRGIMTKRVLPGRTPNLYSLTDYGWDIVDQLATREEKKEVNEIDGSPTGMCIVTVAHCFTTSVKAETQSKAELYAVHNWRKLDWGASTIDVSSRIVHCEEAELRSIYSIAEKTSDNKKDCFNRLMDEKLNPARQ